MEFADIVRSPWESSLHQWMSEASDRVRVAAPYIKLDAAELLVAAISRSVDLRVLTKFQLHSFERGVSDLAALTLLKSRCAHLKTSPRLHAKLYVIDDSRAVVTSGNLT